MLFLFECLTFGEKSNCTEGEPQGSVLKPGNKLTFLLVLFPWLTIFCLCLEKWLIDTTEIVSDIKHHPAEHEMHLWID